MNKPEGCSNHSCLINPPIGMGTNSSCTCVNSSIKMQRYIRWVNYRINKLTTELEWALREFESYEGIERLEQVLQEE